MKSKGGAMELVRLRDTSMKQHLSACSFRCRLDSMYKEIAVISAWGTV